MAAADFSTEFHGLKRRTMAVGAALLCLSLPGVSLANRLPLLGLEVSGLTFDFLLTGLALWMLVDAVALWVEWKEQSSELLEPTRALDLKSSMRRMNELGDQFSETADQVSQAMNRIYEAISMSQLSKISRIGFSQNDLAKAVASASRELRLLREKVERLASDSRKIRRRIRGIALMANLRASALPLGVPMLLCIAAFCHYVGHMGVVLFPSAPEILRLVTGD